MINRDKEGLKFKKDTILRWYREKDTPQDVQENLNWEDGLEPVAETPIKEDDYLSFWSLWETKGGYFVTVWPGLRAYIAYDMIVLL